MCTLLVAARVVPGHPLVVIANRDELLARPARGPFVWPEGFVAPKDELAGGTWLGVTRSRLFVGVTNRHQGGRDASRRSRGELVTRALASSSAREAHAAAASLSPRDYNPFHLVYADGDDVLATISDGETLTQLSLGEGVTVVTERSFGAGDDRARAARALAAWERARADGGSVERFTRVLAEHDEAAPHDATCLHLPGLGYGTRSAMVLATDDAGGATMLWAEGPPCTTPFSPVALPFGKG